MSIKLSEPESSKSIYYKATVAEALEMLQGNLEEGQLGGFLTVVDDNLKVIGVLTDSDIRRNVKILNFTDKPIIDFYRKDFIKLYEYQNLQEMANFFRNQLELRDLRTKYPITYVPILDDNEKLFKVMHINQLIELISPYLQEIVIIGLGFVGLTLASAIARSGQQVIGIEKNQNTLNKILDFEPEVFEPGLVDILRKTLNSNFKVFSKFDDLPKKRIFNSQRIYIITVGTPVVNNIIDDTAIVSASNAISVDLNEGDMVITRSTVPVGATRETVGKIINQASGLKPGKDFYLVSAPERTVEGNAIEEISLLPQIIGGLGEECTSKAVAFFSRISPNTVVMESLEASEFSKLMSNAYRDVNFNFANEMSLIASNFNFDINETIKKSNLGYSRNQIPQPSPGVGGPCLTKDSRILLKSVNHQNSSIIKAARDFNEKFINDIAVRIKENIPEQIALLAVGLTFKGLPNTNDYRDSTGIMICDKLKYFNVDLYYYDEMGSNRTLDEANLKIHDQLEEIIKKVEIEGILILNNNPNHIKPIIEVLSNRKTKMKLIFDPWKIFSEDLAHKFSVKYLTLSRSVNFEE